MDSPPKAKKRPSPAVSRRNSSKFFRCFKPAVVDFDDDGGDEGERGSDGTLFAYVAAKESDGRVSPEVATGGKGDDWSDEDPAIKKKKKKKKVLASLARASKAVFFETSLAKKMRKRESTKSSPESINLLTEADRILKLMHQNSGSGVSHDAKVAMTESEASTSLGSSVAGTVSPSLSSSRSSSTNSSPQGRTKSSTRSSSFNSKHIQSSAAEDGKERPPSSFENSAICLLLVILLVLVLWGKVCAIVCTSTWLFFMPRWSIIKLTNSPLDDDKDSPPDLDSAEYKKKIILEGLLQRKQLRGAQHLRAAMH